MATQRADGGGETPMAGTTEATDTFLAHLDMDAKYTEIEMDNFLSHYGVKGMRWGVRKDRVNKTENLMPSSYSSSGMVKGSRPYKKDLKWAKKASNIKQRLAIWDSVAAEMNGGGIAKFNAQPRWKDLDLREPNPLAKKYFDEFSKMYTEKLNAAQAAKEIGSSPSGKVKLVYNYDVGRDILPMWRFEEKK